MGDAKSLFFFPFKLGGLSLFYTLLIWFCSIICFFWLCGGLRDVWLWPIAASKSEEGRAARLLKMEPEGEG